MSSDDFAVPLPFGSASFSEAERDRISSLLERKLASEEIATRAGPKGSRLAYLETHRAIEIANFVFNYNGWSSSVQDLTQDFMEDKGGKYSCGISAIVRVTLKDGCFHEDIGYGVSLNQSDRAGALEKAKKEAVSDGLKRALRLFGNGLGNSIYDQDYVKKVKSGQIATEAIDMNREAKRMKIEHSMAQPMNRMSSGSIQTQQAATAGIMSGNGGGASAQQISATSTHVGPTPIAASGAVHPPPASSSAAAGVQRPVAQPILRHPQQAATVQSSNAQTPRPNTVPTSVSVPPLAQPPVSAPAAFNFPPVQSSPPISSSLPPLPPPPAATSTFPSAFPLAPTHSPLSSLAPSAALPVPVFIKSEPPTIGASPSVPTLAAQTPVLTPAPAPARQPAEDADAAVFDQMFYTAAFPASTSTPALGPEIDEQPRHPLRMLQPAATQPAAFPSAANTVASQSSATATSKPLLPSAQSAVVSSAFNFPLAPGAQVSGP